MMGKEDIPCNKCTQGPQTEQIISIPRRQNKTTQH